MNLPKGTPVMPPRSLTRTLTAWYARVALRPLRHLDPRAVFRVDGVYVPGGAEPSPDSPAEAIRLAVIGDSTALGAGVRHPRQASGALLAQWLAEETGRPVRVEVHARFGATTGSLGSKVDRAVRFRPDLAVFLTGANDSLLPLPLGRAARALGRHVRRLTDTGTKVVVSVTLDAGCAPALPRLAGRLLSLRCRRLGRLQAHHALRQGARVVSFRDEDFRTHAARLFAEDRFHPSAAGYELFAGRLMHAMLAGWGADGAVGGVGEGCAGFGAGAGCCEHRDDACGRPAGLAGRRSGDAGAGCCGNRDDVPEHAGPAGQRSAAVHVCPREHRQHRIGSLRAIARKVARTTNSHAGPAGPAGPVGAEGGFAFDVLPPARRPWGSGALVDAVQAAAGAVAAAPSASASAAPDVSVR